jgi:hypothetical protein
MGTSRPGNRPTDKSNSDRRVDVRTRECPACEHTTTERRGLPVGPGAMGVSSTEPPGADRTGRRCDALGERAAPAARVRRSLCHSAGQLVTGGAPTPHFVDLLLQAASPISPSEEPEEIEPTANQEQRVVECPFRSVSVPVASAGSACPSGPLPAVGKMGHDSIHTIADGDHKVPGLPHYSVSPCGVCPVQK